MYRKFEGLDYFTLNLSSDKHCWLGQNKMKKKCLAQTEKRMDKNWLKSKGLVVYLTSNQRKTVINVKCELV